jgi:hypothetical protein
MPMRRELYSKNWNKIVAAVRERSGNRCEGSPAYPECRAVNGQPHPVTGSKVVLTTAHLNHQPSDCRMENLASFCQLCHNTYDIAHRAENRRKTRDERLGQRRLAFEPGPESGIYSTEATPL